MRVKLMTFRYSTSLGGFDDRALTDFIRDKEVIAFREHFYTVNEVPHLSCVVHYQDAVVPVEALRAMTVPTPLPPTTLRPTRNEARASDEVPEAAADLDTNQLALFNHLREWRQRTARAEGLPPYVLFTNRELVAIVRARPDSPTALGHIDGVGPGKVKRFGRGLLEALHGAPPPAPLPAPTAQVDPLPAASMGSHPPSVPDLTTSDLVSGLSSAPTATKDDAPPTGGRL